MSHETTLVYNEQIIRQAIFRFLCRSFGFGYMGALVAAALGFGWFVAEEDGAWAGVMGTVLFVGIAGAVMLYSVHYRTSVRKFREMGSMQATFRADESAFTLTSAIGTSTLRWLVVKELWRFPGVWLLLYSEAQFNILPLHCLSPEMQAFIVQRVQAAGGKIVN